MQNRDLQSLYKQLTSQLFTLKHVRYIIFYLTVNVIFFNTFF